MRPAHEVYASQMRELRHGYALWCPEPCQYGEVKAGDVGYLRDGAFHRLFNAILPEDDPEQILGVPVAFEPLVLPPGSMWRNDKIFDSGNMRSSSVAECRYGISASGAVLPGGAGVHFSCSRKQGAILHLSRKAIREEAQARQAFESYTLRNFPNWYEFANSVLFRGVKNGDIMLITGCDKTAEWASAVFDERSRNTGISLIGDVGPVASAELTLTGRWESSTSVQHRSGPIYDDPELVKFDQAIFIRGYKVLERKIRAPKIIRAEAEPRPPSVDEDSDDSSAALSTGSSSEFEYIVQSIEGDSTPYHPSDALLEYILEHSDAPVAIVHDDHWCGSLIHPALEGSDFASISSILDSYERRFCQSDDIAPSSDQSVEEDLGIGVPNAPVLPPPHERQEWDLPISPNDSRAGIRADDDEALQSSSFGESVEEGLGVGVPNAPILPPPSAAQISAQFSPVPGPQKNINAIIEGKLYLSNSLAARSQQKNICAIIEGKLYLSNIVAARSTRTLAEWNVTHMLSVGQDAVPAEMPQSGIHHMRIPVEDVDYADLLRHLPSACQFIGHAIRSGGVVLVHDVQGLSSSAAVVAAYLMWAHRINATNALERIKRVREQIWPNAGFQEQLVLFELCEYAPSPHHGIYQSWKNKLDRQLRAAGLLQ